MNALDFNISVWDLYHLYVSDIFRIFLKWKCLPCWRFSEENWNMNIFIQTTWSYLKFTKNHQIGDVASSKCHQRLNKILILLPTLCQGNQQNYLQELSVMQYDRKLWHNPVWSAWACYMYARVSYSIYAWQSK